MTEITDLSTTDSSNTTVTGESIDGAIANMGRMDNTLQAILGLLARSIRTNVLRFLDNADPTKKVALDLSGLPTATERTWTAPYHSGTLGLVSDIRGYIFGLTLTNDAGDTANDIAFAAGSAVDSTGTASMLLASSLVKRVDATWVAGTNQGGRFYTTLVDGNIYEYVIRNPTTGVVDSGFSDNATTPTGGASYPAGFTQYALVGKMARTSGVNGVPYLLDGRPQQGTPVGYASATYTANTDITATTIPFDDTIPQITEGVEIVNVTITPRFTTSRLKVTFSGQTTLSTTGSIVAAIYQNGSANAIGVGYVSIPSANLASTITVMGEMTAGITTPITFSVRVAVTSGAARFNGNTSGRLWGGASAAFIRVEEVKA